MLLTVVLQIILVVLNVLFFLWVDSDCGAVTWISYACATLAYIVVEFALLLPRSDKGRAWGYVLPYIAISFFVVELISGIVLSLVTESVALALTVHLLVISAFVVWGSLHIAANRNSASAFEQQKKNAEYVKVAGARLKAMSLMVHDDDARRELSRLYDTVWSSPVKSNDMAREYEYKVISGIDELEIAVSAGRWADVVALSQRLSIVAGTRNRMLSI